MLCVRKECRLSSMRGPIFSYTNQMLPNAHFPLTRIIKTLEFFFKAVESLRSRELLLIFIYEPHREVRARVCVAKWHSSNQPTCMCHIMNINMHFKSKRCLKSKVNVVLIYPNETTCIAIISCSSNLRLLIHLSIVSNGLHRLFFISEKIFI